MKIFRMRLTETNRGEMNINPAKVGMWVCFFFTFMSLVYPDPKEAFIFSFIWSLFYFSLGALFYLVSKGVISMKIELSNFRSFMLGALFTCLIVVIILLAFWNLYALPWLHGVAYNMQLDEAALRALGVNHPTSNYQAMWDQVARLMIIGQ